MSSQRARSAALVSVEQLLPFRFAVLAGRMTRALGRVYTETFRLLAPEWRVLAVLGRFGAMAANDLRDRTTMDKVRVSRSITRLMQRGYISRESDPLDRRRAILRLTVSGENIYKEIAPRVLAAEAEILASLTAQQRAVLAEVIDKLEDQMAYLPASPEDDGP